ncbi:hypothetical protein AB1Y20_010009 [Prymnesium parvum]|uniref:Uncharacterized protein n=1 Tax=Prymnesium parvum TaxID=97485 RepID=A0AB34K645_PRYPA
MGGAVHLRRHPHHDFPEALRLHLIGARAVREERERGVGGRHRGDAARRGGGARLERRRAAAGDREAYVRAGVEEGGEAMLSGWTRGRSAGGAAWTSDEEDAVVVVSLT